jgi:hypothetical protein
MAQRRDLLARAHASPPHIQINEKRRRAFFMLGEIAHEYVEDVTVQEKVHDSLSVTALTTVDNTTVI